MDTGMTKTYSSFPWFAIRDGYINSVINSNGLPLMLPSKPNLADYYFKLIDGILITGGDFDIDPKLYGEKKSKSVNHLDKPRTNFELKLAKLALKKNIPEFQKNFLFFRYFFALSKEGFSLNSST